MKRNAGFYMLQQQVYDKQTKVEACQLPFLCIYPCPVYEHESAQTYMLK